MSPEMPYTLTMALQNYLPVLLFALGLWWATQVVAILAPSSLRLAQLGTLLITIGGLSKATWKLLMATTNGSMNVVWLSNSLFIWLAPGFILIATALWATVRSGDSDQKRWRLPLALISMMLGTALLLALAFPTARYWNSVLLGVTTLTNFVVAGIMIRHARRHHAHWIAFLFAFNLVGLLVLARIAAIPHTWFWQWVEQLTNTFVSGAFAYAAYHLLRLERPMVEKRLLV